MLRAMKRYGLIVADNGSNWFFSGTSDQRPVTDGGTPRRIPRSPTTRDSVPAGSSSWDCSTPPLPGSAHHWRGPQPPPHLSQPQLKMPADA